MNDILRSAGLGLLCLAWLSTPVLAADVARPDPAASQALRHFFDEEWEWNMREAPEDATLLGDRRYDDRLSDLSKEAIARRKAHRVDVLKRARAFDPAQLGETDRISLELFISIAERGADLARFPVEVLNIGPNSGPHRDLPTLAQVPTFREPKHFHDYAARLQAIPRYIDQTIALCEAGRKSGWIIAREPSRNLPALIRSVRAARVEDSVFYQPFTKLPATMPAAERTALLDAARPLIGKVDAAFEKLAAYVEHTYLPAAKADVGAWALPDGAAYYEAAVRGHTTTRKTVDEIHALGLSEVRRISGEMDKVIRGTGYTGTRAAWNDMLRTDARFFYKDGAQLLTGYRDIAKRIDGALPRLFGKLPRLPYGVIPTPDYEAPTSTTAYYREGAAEDGRAGNFVANLYKPETRPKWEMEALTLHEAVPGHHLQIALAQELTDLPRFRREIDFTAFIEGWGLYAESLGPELGMFTDPYAKYGQLTYEMWRAVRLVVDTGMHAKHWTRKQAIDYFLENTAKTQHDIEVEVDRYIGWPGQALAYKIGELELKRLRALAERTLGARFDIRRFHDVVLGAGAMPLEMVDRRVREWLDAEKSTQHGGAGR